MAQHVNTEDSIVTLVGLYSASSYGVVYLVSTGETCTSNFVARTHILGLSSSVSCSAEPSTMSTRTTISSLDFLSVYAQLLKHSTRRGSKHTSAPFPAESISDLSGPVNETEASVILIQSLNSLFIERLCLSHLQITQIYKVLLT